MLLTWSIKCILRSVGMSTSNKFQVQISTITGFPEGQRWHVTPHLERSQESTPWSIDTSIFFSEASKCAITACETQHALIINLIKTKTKKSDVRGTGDEGLHHSAYSGKLPHIDAHLFISVINCLLRHRIVPQLRKRRGLGAGTAEDNCGEARVRQWDSKVAKVDIYNYRDMDSDQEVRELPITWVTKWKCCQSEKGVIYSKGNSSYSDETIATQRRFPNSMAKQKDRHGEGWSFSKKNWIKLFLHALHNCFYGI